MGGYMNRDDTLPIKPCPICGGEMVLVYKSDIKAYVFYHIDDNKKCYEHFKLLPTPSVICLSEARDYWNQYCVDEENNIIPVQSQANDKHKRRKAKMKKVFMKNMIPIVGFLVGYCSICISFYVLMGILLALGKGLY